jgi:hypothetical protein
LQGTRNTVSERRADLVALASDPRLHPAGNEHCQVAPRFNTPLTPLVSMPALVNHDHAV